MKLLLHTLIIEWLEFTHFCVIVKMPNSINLLGGKGIQSFITPNSWLKNIQFTNCREFILKNSFINILFPNLQNVFDEASVDTLIFICSRKEDNRITSIMEFKNKTAIEKHKINQSRFQQNERKIFDVEINDEINVIIQKIRNDSSHLSRFSEITRGVNPYDKYTGQSQEIIDLKAYHSTFAKDETFKPELRGKHIGCYHFLWDKKSYISYGDWLAAPRDIKFFQGNRIVMRQVLGKKFNCTVLDEDFIIDQSVFIAKPKIEFEDKIQVIQGLLASKLVVFFFKHTNNEFDALFPKIKIGEFKELPIFSEIEKIPTEFTIKVTQILDLKQQNPSADTTALEAEIDEMVYQLYGLTDEEKQIVENS
ncbi:MAG: TaqI-like C-terminal specificity domain-containing protein [Draconibacterium sp.]